MNQNCRSSISVKRSFAESESVYLCQRNLGRLATVSTSGEPHVVPVGYEFDGHYVYFGGWGLRSTLMFKHILRNPKVAFVVDDLSTNSSVGYRGLEIRGSAEILQANGVPYIRMTPESVRSWGLPGY
jgi:pyridoxamine 5'-phosphate oxidase family protein